MWSPTHVQVTVQRARGLLTKGKNKSNDCLVTIALGKEKYQTSVKERATGCVEWHEECELRIPQRGNTAEIVLTALHRNFLSVDEFLGTVSVPLASFDVYERPRNRWYTLGNRPGRDNAKDRGELEVKIGFIVKAGSLTDLTRKESHESSLGQPSTAARSIGGSLLSVGSLERREGLKRFARSVGNRLKGRSRDKSNGRDPDEREEARSAAAAAAAAARPSRQEPGRADPGVISEDEDEFTFDDLSHKSSASSLNAPHGGGPGAVAAAAAAAAAAPVSFESSSTSSSPLPPPPPPPQRPPSSRESLVAAGNPPGHPSVAAPDKPPRFSSGPNPTRNENREDEWGRKLYGEQRPGVLPKRWDNVGSGPRIVVDEPLPPPPLSPAPSPPAPRDDRAGGSPADAPRFERNGDDESPPAKGKTRRDERSERAREKSPRKEKLSERDKRRDKDRGTRDAIGEGRPSSERIIIGGEDASEETAARTADTRLPREVLAQFEGKSREDLVELALRLQTEVTDKRKRLADLEEYIDALLLRVIESSPRLLQNPYQSRRLSSPGRQC